MLYCQYRRVPTVGIVDKLLNLSLLELRKNMDLVLGTSSTLKYQESVQNFRMNSHEVILPFLEFRNQPLPI